MLDEALLRPGRLEVHVEIGLPDEKGRVQILKVFHFWITCLQSFPGPLRGRGCGCVPCRCPPQPPF